MQQQLRELLSIYKISSFLYLRPKLGFEFY